MADEKIVEFAERLCAEILSLTEKGYMRGEDLLKMSDVCLEVCKRVKAEADIWTKPVSDVLN